MNLIYGQKLVFSGNSSRTDTDRSVKWLATDWMPWLQISVGTVVFCLDSEIPNTARNTSCFYTLICPGHTQHPIQWVPGLFPRG